MTRKKESLPLKISLLLFAGVIIIVFSGYLSYRSISSVVTLIYRNNAPTHGLATIREITTTIDRAENNVRLYSLTKESYYLNKYRSLIGGIDSLIAGLYNQYPENDWFSQKIDTISLLVDTKISVWGEMITIWQYDTAYQAISQLAERFQPVKEEPAADSVVKQGFFRRIFGRKNREVEAPAEDPSPRNEEILEMIGEIEKIERETGMRLQEQETELTRSSSSLTSAFLSLMGQLEAYERERDLERYEQAGELSDKTYLLLGIFSVSATLLSILVMFLVIKYTRKNREYNEALIRSREKTEELARTKELFMANVSHEIRNPLNAISGFIKQMMNMPVDKGIREKIEIVDSASEQLIRLANDTLDLSKLQAGKLTLYNGHFDPETEVRNVCALFTQLAEENKNTLRYEVVNEENLYLYGDAQRFQQVLYNLLSNAIKFTENGRIDVTARIETAEGDEVKLSLSVKDTGCGIEGSKLEKIFEDFAQENETTAVKYGGTGLGLSIVKKLVELFQGKIGVQSTKGTGTEVTCELKFRVGDARVAEQQGLEQERGSIPGGLRFLVADDEAYNRRLVTTMLDKWNAVYDVATNGNEAVNLLSINHYDMALMDLRMPGIDGINAAKFIRETLKFSRENLPVVGISADTLDQLGTATKDLFNAFLTKPFSENQMAETINRALGMPGAIADKSVEVRPEAENQMMEGTLTNLVQMSGDDMSFVEEMIHNFENSTLEGLEEMNEALDEGRFGTVRDLAHKLKPPSRHLGLDTLGKLLEEIEKRAPRGNRSLLRGLISEAKKSSNEAGKHLHDQLRQMHK